MPKKSETVTVKCNIEIEVKVMARVNGSEPIHIGTVGIESVEGLVDAINRAERMRNVVFN